MKYREWPPTIGSLTNFVTSYVLCLRVLKLSFRVLKLCFIVQKRCFRVLKSLYRVLEAHL